MLCLSGLYQHKVDAKGRMSLPADFRKLVPERLYVTLSPESNCLYIFEESGFTSWVESLFEKDGGFQPSNLCHVKIRKVLNSRAKIVDVDASGRICISQEQRELASLGTQVSIIGDNDHFEVWNSERWASFADDVDLMSLFD